MEDSITIQPAIYGFEVLCAVGMGAANQFRTMGSAFGLAIATSIFNGYTVAQLGNLEISDSGTSLAPAQLAALPLDTQLTVRTILSEGYDCQMLALAVLTAAEVPAALLMWRRKQIITV
ncbi:hypothetical protein VM1G_04971 [Cytospora mali]|uniref:HC-toxin efflux carrier TOXA n=1 Tax=Cytospora mali TaxID=578113 RepID=A0A194VYZ1_CYTMA|nr:hypothetical protein VM1G_04971 [Valsa mali]